MTRQLLLSVSPGEIWAALIEDGTLAALKVLRSGVQGLPGEIHLGRIVAMKPELPAALVDIGLERPGFLSGEDASPRGGLSRLYEGQAIVVQVTKEARANKATGLSMRWRLPGDTVGEERRRITDAAAAPGRVPRPLDAPATPLAVALETFLAAKPDAIVVDAAAALAEARQWLSRRGSPLGDRDRVALHRDRAPLFDAHGVGEAVAAVLAPHVPLAGRGSLIIEHTDAATVIDVDSGGAGSRGRDAAAAALATNLEAAREVARQIRLRSLAGPIVVDFVGMHLRDDRAKVQNALAQSLADDRDCEVLGWTRLGHLELVRKRRHAPLAELLFERAANGGLRKTALTLALEALRRLAREAEAKPGARAARVYVHPEVAAVLAAGAGAARDALAARLGYGIEVAAEPGRARETIDIRLA